MKTNPKKKNTCNKDRIKVHGNYYKNTSTQSLMKLSMINIAIQYKTLKNA